MAGTIVVDRIESDASYASTINVAGQITFSNTVNFGAFAGTAPVAGFYLPTTNNLAFTTASTERMRITSAGAVLVNTVTQTGSTRMVVADATGNGQIRAIHSTGLGLLINQATASGAAYINQQDNADLAFATNNSERMRIDSSGNVGIGTSSPSTYGAALAVVSPNTFGTVTVKCTGTSGAAGVIVQNDTNTADCFMYAFNSATGTLNAGIGTSKTQPLALYTNNTEQMRIDSSGRVLVGTTSTNLCAGDTVGIGLNTTINGTYAVGAAQFSANGTPALNVNRKTDDGNLVTFSQAGTSEGTISVSGTTVSYNGGHLSRWAQTTAPKDDTLVKGTVLSNLDEMNVYTDADGNPVDNEQLNKVKVSDVEGDANVAGVFVNWTHDDAHDVDEINMAMTGDMIIRIAQGVTVQRGDLLMSAGNGTAKPQGDDIVRSKTIAKVTSTHVTCTYADGSFCVPCVLMAC